MHEGSPKPIPRCSNHGAYRLSLSWNRQHHPETELRWRYGYEIPLWTEYVKDEHKFGYQIHARLLAVAESCWTKPILKNYDNFEYRLENMREFFTAGGLIIPPRKMYNGYTFDGAENMTFFERKEVGFRKNWFFDVDCEYKVFKDLTK